MNKPTRSAFKVRHFAWITAREESMCLGKLLREQEIKKQKINGPLRNKGIPVGPFSMSNKTNFHLSAILVSQIWAH